jgi:hypothetical protein
LNGGQRHKAPRLVDTERLSSSTLAVRHEVTIPQVEWVLPKASLLETRRPRGS